MPFASLKTVMTCLMRASALSVTLFFTLLATVPSYAEEDALALFEWIKTSPHAQRVDQRDEQVRSHLIGLGRINKVRGEWSPSPVERVSGHLFSSTWKIEDGVSSVDMFEDVVARIEDRGDAELLFACSARACGPSVQWANLVFGQRILYGREVSQTYRAYALGAKDAPTQHRLVIYATARTNDRQYLYTELVVLEP